MHVRFQVRHVTARHVTARHDTARQKSKVVQMMREKNLHNYIDHCEYACQISDRSDHRGYPYGHFEASGMVTTKSTGHFF